MVNLTPSQVTYLEILSGAITVCKERVDPPDPLALCFVLGFVGETFLATSPWPSAAREALEAGRAAALKLTGG